MPGSRGSSRPNRTLHFFRTTSLLLAGLTITTSVPGLTLRWGEIEGSFDSTLSVGAVFRLEDPQRRFFATTAGGEQASVNVDDGNLNYAAGLASLAFKGTHDLDLRYRNFGLFVRGSYFYDVENEEGDRERTPLSDEAKEKVGANADILDAFLYARFDLGPMPVDIRVGSQVVSWGESTFIQNGINVINAIDVARLRVPGSEIREALKPAPLALVSLGLTENTSLEALYLFEFSKTEIDPAGTYFSTNDFASIGGRTVFLGFGSLPDTGTLGGIPRAENRKARDDGQFGLALRSLVPALGEAEVGLFFLNYHSRLPLISAFTPTVPVNTNLTGPLTTALLRAGVPSSAAPAQAASIFQLLVLSQTNPAALTPAQVATLQAPTTQAAIAGARQIAFLTSAATGRYLIEYPEDIRLYGLSLSTTLGSVALQGEVSWRQDQPLQVDDVELLFAALSAINPAFGAPNNQIGSFLGQLGRYLPGYREFDVGQVQVTATRVYGPMLGADQFTLVGEVGATWVPDLPGREDQRLDGSGTFTSGNAAAMVATGNGAFPATESSAFADAFSWGYQIVGRLEYNNVLFGANVLPTVAFAHDVGGNTPLPLGNFLEGRLSLTVGAEIVLQNAWSLDVRYTGYFGGGSYNLIADRDFVSTTLKYSF